MIIQGILNWWADFVSILVQFIPPLPDSWNTGLAGIADGGAFLANKIAAFGIIAPFNTLGQIITAWAGLLGLWGAALAVRVVLRVLGR